MKHVAVAATFVTEPLTEVIAFRSRELSTA